MEKEDGRPGVARGRTRVVLVGAVADLIVVRARALDIQTTLILVAV